MRIPRIYQNQALEINSKVELTTDAAHHIIKVLRCTPGSRLILFNGDGAEYEAVIESATKRHATVHIEKKTCPERESTLDLEIGQVISKGERMDFVMQKTVELGVKAITPLFSDYCNVKLPKERIPKRLAHWQAVIINAAEQSGRTSLMQLNQPMQLTDWLAQPFAGLKLMLDTQASINLSEQQQAPKKIRLLIGPEGGFSDAERRAATEAGYAMISLGPRILRTETAALAASAILQHQFG